MLLILVVLTVLLIVFTWGYQAMWSLRLACCYPSRTPIDPPNQTWPPATILLSLRGADPVLNDCLRGLCRLDYPDYEIRIVIDSADDPAWGMIREVLADFPSARITTQLLTDRRTTCSLKVSALLQALTDLPVASQVVALIDADVVPPTHWLRDLVRPLLEPGIGASTGIRWYHTHCKDWGSIARTLWGAAAAGQMYSLGIPWGGTLAFRAELLRDPELLDAWAHSFVEDVSCLELLQRRGLRLRIVPRLTMLNPESISLTGLCRFVRRQLLCVRLYHPAWRRVLLTSLGMAVSVPLAGLVGWLAWLGGDETLAWVVLGTQLAAMVVSGLALIWIDGYFYYTAPADAPLSRLHWKHVPCVPLAMLVNLQALLAARRTSEVDWRGIHYTVAAPHEVRMVEYVPYAPALQDHDKHSIL